ncbi:hypothetical protein [Caudoviricetes sp.]|nr:hypothetical protein [Caudoviricetes sp.]
MKRLIWITAGITVLVGLANLSKPETTAAGHHPEFNTTASCESDGRWRTSIDVFVDDDRPELTWEVIGWGEPKTAIVANPFSQVVYLSTDTPTYTFSGIARWSNGQQSPFSVTTQLNLVCVKPAPTTSGVVETIPTTTSIVPAATTTTVQETTTTVATPVETAVPTTVIFDIGTPDTRVLPETK